jgi:tetratricopeptide (TPR) repeat protein
LVCQAYQHLAAADYRPAFELTQRAIAMWRRHGLMPRPEGARFLGYIFTQLGEYRSALAALDEAEHYDGGFVGDPTLRASLITTAKVTALVELGQFDEALACADRGLRPGEEMNHHHSLALAGYARGRVALGKGDTDAAITALERSVTLCGEGQYASAFPMAAGWLGCAYLLAGRVEDAIGILGEAVRCALPTHTFCSLALAEAWLDAGLVEEARQVAESSLATAQRIGERGTSARALRLLGVIGVEAVQADRKEPERHYREALALAGELGMRPLVAHCHLGLGKLYRLTGKREEAHDHLTTATTMYREMGMTYWLEKAKAEMAEAESSNRGRTTEEDSPWVG